MVWLLICLGCALDEVLAGLAHRARESSRRVRAPSEDASSYEPGFYDINGISFTLRSRIIGHADASILGYAATSSVLALLSNPIDADSILVDEEQRLLRIGRMFTTDKDVLFYNISIESPLVVFGNLRFRTTANNAPANDNRRVGDTRKIAEGEIFQWPSPIEKDWRFNWDSSKERPKQIEGDKFEYLVDGKLSAAAWAEWQFSGTNYLRVNTGFDIRGQIETGFKVNAKITEKAGFTARTIPEECADLTHSPETAVAGLTMRLELYVCANASLADVPKQASGYLEYRRPWTVRAVRSGLFTTQAQRLAGPRVELSRLKEVTSGATPASRLPKSLPAQLRLYGRTNVTLGRKSWEATLGVGASIEWNFESGAAGGCLGDGFFRRENFSFWPFHVQPEVKVDENVLLKRETIGVDEKGVKEKGIDTSKLNTSVAGCIVKGSSEVPTGAQVVEQTQDTVGVLPSFNFRNGQTYGSIDFKSLLSKFQVRNVPDVYALARLDDCTPMIDAHQLGDGLWAIRLGADFPGVLKVYRRSNGVQKYEGLGIEKIFAGPPELFCKDGRSKFQVGASAAGCVAPTAINGSISNQWGAFVDEKSPKPTVEWIEKLGLHYIATVDPGISASSGARVNLVMARKNYILDNDALLNVVPGEDVKAIRKSHGNLLLVDNRGTAVYFYINGVRSKVEANGLTLSGDNAGYAVSESSGQEGALQVFRLYVGDLSLLKFRSADGLVQVAGASAYYHPGFRYQVVPQSEAYVYKTWKGPFTVERLPKDDKATLHVRGELTKTHVLAKDEWRLALVLITPDKDFLLPWGATMYNKDPGAFFQGLGIQKKGETYTAGDVTFGTGGEIQAYQGQMDFGSIKGLLKVAQGRGAQILQWLDVGDPTKIGWKFEVETFDTKKHTWKPVPDDVAEEEADNGLGADALTLIEVAVGALVGALIITLVGVLIYRRRLRANEKSSSTVSDRTSSDGICQDGLIETGE